jgi:hypothetical protein
MNLLVRCTHIARGWAIPARRPNQDKSTMTKIALGFALFITSGTAGLAAQIDGDANPVRAQIAAHEVFVDTFASVRADTSRVVVIDRDGDANPVRGVY